MQIFRLQRYALINNIIEIGCEKMDKNNSVS